MGFFNAIWQGDANSYALRSLELCSSPPAVLNVTGAERIAVRETAEWFGSVFGRTPRFVEQRRTGGAAQRFEPLPRAARRARGAAAACCGSGWRSGFGGGASAEQADTLRGHRWPVLTRRPLRRCGGRSSRGLVIPAHPLALTETRPLDERRQVALTRYYCDAGAGGLAVGVHTTQFEIRDPAVGLLEPVLSLAASDGARSWCASRRAAGHDRRCGRADRSGGARGGDRGLARLRCRPC